MIKEAIERMRKRHDQSMEDLAARVGVSSQALYKAMKASGSTVIGYDTAMRIADEAGFTDDERFELETAWLENRMRAGSLGRVVKVMMAELRTLPKARLRDTFRKMLAEYRGPG